MFDIEEVFNAISSLSIDNLPLPDDIHFKKVFPGGNPDHFYLYRPIILDSRGRKLTQEDWERLKQYIIQQNYGDLTYYNKYYTVKTIYEEYIERDGEFTKFRDKYKNKTLEQLYIEADKLDSIIKPDPMQDPTVIEVIKANQRFIKSSGINIQNAIDDFHHRMQSRDEIEIEVWKRKLTRYRMCICQRSLAEFLSDPLKMIRICWYYAFKAIETKIKTYTEQRPFISPKARHKKFNTFCYQYKIYGMSHFQDDSHMCQYIRTKVFKQFSNSKPWYEMMNRKEFRERRDKENERRKKEQEEYEMALELGITIDEFRELLEKEAEREQEKKQEKSTQKDGNREQLASILGMTEEELDEFVKQEIS